MRFIISIEEINILSSFNGSDELIRLGKQIANLGIVSLTYDFGIFPNFK